MTREWTVLEALTWCTRYLEEHDDPNPRLSAQWLLSYATGLSRVEVYAYHDRPLSLDERAQLREMLERRGTGEPLQYIEGVAPFRNLELHVTPDVLIPRPETETLVELVLEYMRCSSYLPEESLREGSGRGFALYRCLKSNPSARCRVCLPPSRRALPEHRDCVGYATARSSAGEAEDCLSTARTRAVGCAPPDPADPLTILDIGTGSGAIALSLAQECPHAQVTATDISPGALAVARANAERLGLQDRVAFIESDCCKALADQRFDIIVSNPPYVASSELPSLEKQVRDFEPMTALDGGEDGLDVFRCILADATDRSKEKGALFVELAEYNVTQAAELAVQLSRYEKVVVRPDLNGRDRFVVATGSRD